MTTTVKYVLAGLALLLLLLGVKAAFDHQDAKFQRRLGVAQANADSVLAFVAGSYQNRVDSLTGVTDSLKKVSKAKRATARVARVHADSVVAAGVPDTCLPATEALNAALKAAWDALLTDSTTIATQDRTIAEQEGAIVRLKGSLNDLRDVSDDLAPRSKWYKSIIPSITVGPFAGVCEDDDGGGLDLCYGVGVGLQWTLLGPK